MEAVIREYVSRDGAMPFARWFDGLDRTAAAKVLTALARLRLGHTANVKAVGGGVYEYKIHFGPGYRVYFGKAGAAIILLLGGGTKVRQSRDIAEATARWADYQQRARE